MKALDLPFTVQKSRWRIAGPLIVSLVAFMISLDLLEAHEQWLWIWALLVVSGVTGFVCLVILFQAQPGLTVSGSGISDPMWSFGMVRWEDIRTIFIQKDGSVDYLCVALHDPKEFRQRMSKVERASSWAASQTEFGDVYVKLSDLGCDTQQVFELVMEQLEQARRRARKGGAKQP